MNPCSRVDMPGGRQGVCLCVAQEKMDGLSMLMSQIMRVDDAGNAVAVQAIRTLASGLLISTAMCSLPLFTPMNANAAGGDTQATATQICSFPYNDTGTTVGMVDNYDLPPDTVSPTLTATCATGTGAGPAGSLPAGAVYTGTGTAPDVVYKMYFPTANPDTLTITMDPTSTQDLALIVYCDACSSSLSDGLAVDDTGVGGVAESVTVSNIQAGSTLYIVVDGYSTGGTPPGPSGPYTLSVTSSGSIQPSCGGDLSITKTDGKAESLAGQTNTYSLGVTNIGSGTSSSVVVTDVLPAGLSFTSANGLGWTCNNVSGTVTCSMPTLAAGASAANILLQVNASLGLEGNVVNTATVASTPADLNLANNTASDTTYIGLGEPACSGSAPVVTGLTFASGEHTCAGTLSLGSTNTQINSGATTHFLSPATTLGSGFSVQDGGVFTADPR